MNSILPQGFQELELFVEDWGNLRDQNQRYLQRQNLPYPQLKSFYDAITPRIEEAFEHLETFTYGEPLPVPQQHLLNLLLGLSEVAQAVEVFQASRVPYSNHPHSVPVKVLR